MRLWLLLLLALAAAPAHAQLNESQLLSGTELDEKPRGLSGADYLLLVQQGITDGMVQQLSGAKAKGSATARIIVDAQGNIQQATVLKASGNKQVSAAMRNLLGTITRLAPPPPELMAGKKSLTMDIAYETPK